MAKAGEKWDDELCAEHDGSTYSFEIEKIVIDEISEFEDLLGHRKLNLLPSSPTTEISHFKIHKIHAGTENNKHAIIFANGLLSENCHEVRDWATQLSDHFNECTWYHLDWEAQNLWKLACQAINSRV